MGEQRGLWESREEGRRETESENIRNSRLIRMSRFSQGVSWGVWGTGGGEKNQNASMVF